MNKGARNKIAVVVLGGAVPVSGVRAAEMPTRRSEANTLSDKELNAFVKAYLDYQRIRLTYVPAFESAEDPTQKQQIEEEANANIKRSLAQGLSPQRYNQIFIQVNSNELLRKKVLKQIEQERNKVLAVQTVRHQARKI